jgi:hypothetical protein
MNDGRRINCRDELLAENLGMKKYSAKILPQALSDDSKQQHLNSNSDL